MMKIIAASVLLVSMTGLASAENIRNAATVNQAASQISNKGKVLEVIDSPMYTYLHVAGNAGRIWLAAYKSDIATGDAIRYSNGVVMRGFSSKSINRTFDKIMFVDSVVVVRK